MRMSREIREAIGRELRRARIDSKQTQKQLADSLGLSRQMICRYENGHDAPSAENLANILKYLRTRIDLPAFGLRLTAEDLAGPAVGPQPVPRQLVLELDKPHDLENAKVRILRKTNSIEIVITHLVPIAR